MQLICTVPNEPLIRECITFLANRVGRLLGARVQRGLEARGSSLQPSQIGILVDLWKQDGQRQQDLAISSVKDKATIARSLDALEQQGWVRREEDEHDRRNKRIYLTTTGRELEPFFTERVMAVEAATMADISAEDLATCRRVLQHIYSNIDPSMPADHPSAAAKI